jgi:hypothetical protein
MIRCALVTVRPPRLRGADEDLEMVAGCCGKLLVTLGVPADWGTPLINRAWFKADRLLALNAGYASGQTAHFRQYRRHWTMAFGYDANLAEQAKAAA